MRNLRFRLWLEATRPLPPPGGRRPFDPALMTTPEYELRADPQHKTHYGRMWDQSLAELSDRNKPADFPELLFRRVVDGVRFEFRVSREDRWVAGRYTKWDPERHDVARGPGGEVLTLSAEEARARFPDRRHDHSFAAFDEEGRCAGVTQDEWGALLVMVAREYRGFGIGPALVRLHRDAEPEKQSGGFTPGGRENFRKAHGEMVRDYSAAGMYSALARRGDITPARGLEIVRSARKASRRPARDLGSSDRSQWLLYAENGAWILYDRKLRDVLADRGLGEDARHHWAEAMVKGLAHVSGGVSGGGGVYYLWHLEADDPSLKPFLMSLAAWWVAEDGSELRVYPWQREFAKPGVVELDGDMARPAGKAPDVRAAVREEAAFRKSFDRYDEFKHEMMELAFAKWR